LRKQENQNKGEKMKKAISIFVALVMIGSLCLGCRKADKSKPEAAEQPKESSAQKWEPETAKQPEGHSADDGHDHSGHNH